MADYWKSLPKKYCDFCKCWITDNKASRDFHERGLRHQANVRRRVKDIQKNSSIREREQQQYNNEMLKIEAAALNAFKGDVLRNPALANERPNTKSLSAQVSRPKADSPPVQRFGTNRFGEAGDSNESEKLVNGKTRALETIAKSFEKKSKWVESKDSNGKSYYWNRDTLETRTEPPKSGFLSLAEQEQFKSLQSASGETSASTGGESNQVYRVDPYGGWRTVERQDANKIIDLQLPDQNVSEIVLELEQNKAAEANRDNQRPAFEFKERTIDSLDKKLTNKKNDQQPNIVSFKKTNRQRNIRNRADD